MALEDQNSGSSSSERIAQIMARIGGKSLFALLSPDKVRFLLAEAEVRDIAPGDPILRREHPGQLFIMAEGAVSLYGRNIKGHREKFGEVTTGRSIELRALLTNNPRWNYQWIAEVKSSLLVIEASRLAEVLETEPELTTYLTRTALNKEIQSLRHDLVLCGFKPALIRQTILALRETERGEIEELVHNQEILVIVRDGTFSVEARVGDRARQLGRFAAGDYTILSRLSVERKFTVGDNARFWTLPCTAWRALVPSATIAAFTQLADSCRSSLASIEGAPRAAVRGAKEENSPIPRTGEESENESSENWEVESDDVDDTESEESPEDSLEVSDDDSDEDSSESEEEYDDDIAEFRVRRRKLWRKKYPHVRQHDEMDCGAACMSMVAKSYGRRISVGKMREIINIDRDGTSVFSLQRAAEKMGINAAGVSPSIEDLPTFRTPFISLQRYHFIVVYRFTKKYVWVGDPAINVYRMTVGKFLEEFSDVVLLLNPTKEFYRFPQTKPAYTKYRLLLTDCVLPMAQILGFSVVIFAFGLAAPIMMQFVFDVVLLDGVKSSLVPLLLLMLTVQTLAILTRLSRNYVMNYVSTKLDTKFSALFLRHVYRLPIPYFAVRTTGDLTSRMADLERIREFFTHKPLTILLNVLTTVLYSVALAFYSFKLILVLALFAPLILFFALVITPKLTQKLGAVYAALSKSTSAVLEQARNIENIQAVGGAVAARWRWYYSWRDGARLMLSFGRWSAISEALSSFLNTGLEIAILLTAVTLYLQDQVSIGQVITIIFLASQVIDPLVSLFTQWKDFQEVGVSFARVDDVITSRAEIYEPAPSQAVIRAANQIEFRDVTFRYGGDTANPVIKKVSLNIQEGETIAFVGRSGSGKSTLAQMLNCLYLPTEGNIFIDGKSVNTWALSQLRKKIVVVMQDSGVFSGSIMENITLGDPFPSLETVVAAAVAADANDFILAQKDGYFTQLGESGSGLSGGQKQRLAIARALYKNPQILILDEATSALDENSEEIVMRNIKGRHKQRTTVIIAHRLNTVLYADRIVVMDQGRIREIGSHYDLLARQGSYYELFRSQLNA